MEIEWNKCAGEIWCELNKLDLDHKYMKGVKGVYIIWYEMQDIITVCIGKGAIRDRLSSDRVDLAVQAFAKYKLKVTWAEVSKAYMDPICAYLSTVLKPKIEIEPIDMKQQIEVNIPWKS